MSKRKGVKRVIALLLVLALLPFGRTETAFAVDTKNVSIHVRYGQTEARTLLGMINTLRASANDAWYWNQGNATQERCTGLKPLVYDYGLEEVAMKRAVEIALVYSHGRPTDKNYYTAFDDCGFQQAGQNSAENIAVGYRNATEVNTAWTEANEKYEGQGHRRNLLNKDYTAVGAAHIQYAGRDYWVEEFSKDSPRTTMVAANDNEALVSVEIASSNILEDKIDTTAVGNSINLNVGGTRDLSGIYETIRVKDHFMANDYCPLRQYVTMSVANTGIATINGNTLTAVANGSTTLNIQCTLGGQQVSVPITVGQGNGNNPNQNNGQNLQNATVDSIMDQRYTGYALTPPVTVRMNNNVLRQNTDYILTYTNNINVGTATVTITGTGQYTGTKTASFFIYGQDIGSATIDAIPAQRYTGSQVRPPVTVRMGNAVLRENSDYTLTYNNNINAGMATVVVNGRGAYSGSKTAAFQILDTDLAHATVTVTKKMTYTGEQRIPDVQVMLNNVMLTLNTDYIISYSNNVEPGQATVTVTGIGNYTGTGTKTFVIVPKKAKLNKVAAARNRKVTVTWRGDDDATGYVLYRSTNASSGFKKIGTYSSSRTRYQSSTMRRGTYYYRIRSYVEIDGKKYYGAYSTVKGVRVR